MAHRKLAGNVSFISYSAVFTAQTESYNCNAGLSPASGDSIPGLWRLDKLSGIRKMIMMVWRPQMIRYITYQQLLSLMCTWTRRKRQW